MDDDKEDTPVEMRERYLYSGVVKPKRKTWGGRIKLTDFEREAFLAVIREIRYELEKKYPR